MVMRAFSSEDPLAPFCTRPVSVAVPEVCARTLIRNTEFKAISAARKQDARRNESREVRGVSVAAQRSEGREWSDRIRHKNSLHRRDLRRARPTDGVFATGARPGCAAR